MISTVVALEVVLAARVSLGRGRRCHGRRSTSVGRNCGSVRTGQLVGTVAAVILLVTLPPVRHAVVIGALEHHGATVALLNQIDNQ